LVIVIVHRRVVSLLLLKILASAGATLLSPCHHLPTRSPSFSLLKRFIVVWGGRGRTSSMPSSPLGSSSLSSLPHPPASSKPLPDNCQYVACWDRSWEGSVCPLGGGGQCPRHLNRTQQKRSKTSSLCSFSFSCGGASRTHNYLATLLYFSTSSYASKNDRRKTSPGTKFALKWPVP